MDAIREMRAWLTRGERHHAFFWISNQVGVFGQGQGVFAPSEEIKQLNRCDTRVISIANSRSAVAADLAAFAFAASRTVNGRKGQISYRKNGNTRRPYRLRSIGRPSQVT
jgi:hypothetical protein